MLAIFKAESGLNPKAIGYNCHYTTKGKTYSTACKKTDRENAWSVDCGIAQNNVKGKTCPKELFEVEHNLEVAYSKYAKRGFSPWSAYKNGTYKKHL